LLKELQVPKQQKSNSILTQKKTEPRGAEARRSSSTRQIGGVLPPSPEQGSSNKLARRRTVLELTCRGNRSRPEAARVICQKMHQELDLKDQTLVRGKKGDRAGGGPPRAIGGIGKGWSWMCGIISALNWNLISPSRFLVLHFNLRSSGMQPSTKKADSRGIWISPKSQWPGIGPPRPGGGGF